MPCRRYRRCFASRRNRLGPRAGHDECQMSAPSIRSPNRHSADVGFEPGIKREQLRVECACKRRVATADELITDYRLKLKHVAEILCARKTEPAVDVERHVAEADLAPDRAPHRRRHLRSGQDFTRDADPRAHGLGAAAEQAIRTLADILHCDAGKLGASERQTKHEVSARFRAWPHAEIKEVLPVERGEQEGGWCSLLGEYAIRRTLRVEVRNLVLAVKRR